MNVIDLEILIPASPDFIWRFLGDLSKSAEWHEGVASLSFLTTQNEGRGTRWRYTTVKGNDIVVEIGAWYDTLGYEYTVVDGAGFGENQGRIRLQEVSDGTLVRWTFNYEFAGVLGGLRNTMRLKRGITKQIQDSLRNLHKLVQQESGGISTHEARSTVREAPGVEERSSYQPRHPSALSDLLTANTESMPDPPNLEPVTFDSEREPDSLSILPEGATKPNPVVQTGNDIVEDYLPPIEIEEATQPIELEIIAYEPNQLEEMVEEAVDETSQTAIEAAQKQVEEQPLEEIAPIQRRAVDTSTVSVFEIFGLQKPSELIPHSADKGLALAEERSTNLGESLGSRSIDDRSERMAELTALLAHDGEPIHDIGQVAESFATNVGAGADASITGLRRLTRQQRYSLRSHNS